MSRPYPYWPAWDGKKEQPITTKLVELCGKRYKTRNLGTYVLRPMRNPTANGALSVHSTGFAADLGADLKTLQLMWDFFVTNSAALRVSEVHFYKAPGTKYGLGYRSSRGEGQRGVKKWTATDNGGPGGLWLHIELEEQDVAHWEAEFRRLKPT
jgi:hypothetical protein